MIVFERVNPHRDPAGTLSIASRAGEDLARQKMVHEKGILTLSSI